MLFVNFGISQNLKNKGAAMSHSKFVNKSDKPLLSQILD
jgi:hypothetical protein